MALCLQTSFSLENDKFKWAFTWGTYADVFCKIFNSYCGGIFFDNMFCPSRVQDLQEYSSTSSPPRRWKLARTITLPARPAGTVALPHHAWRGSGLGTNSELEFILSISARWTGKERERWAFHYCRPRFSTHPPDIFYPPLSGVLQPLKSSNLLESSLQFTNNLYFPLAIALPGRI